MQALSLFRRIVSDSSNKEGTATVGNGQSVIPLTRKAAAVFNLLKKLPADRGMTGDEILDALNDQDPPVLMDQSTLTVRIIPELKAKGVRNRRGVGYYIDPSKSSDGVVSTQS